MCLCFNTISKPRIYKDAVIFRFAIKFGGVYSAKLKRYCVNKAAREAVGDDVELMIDAVEIQ